MTHIRLNIPSEINQALKVYKQIYGYISMEELIIELLFISLSEHKVTSEILKQDQIAVYSIKNPIIKPIHDYFTFREGIKTFMNPEFTYKTQIKFGMINKKEWEFLNKSTREQIERRYEK